MLLTLFAVAWQSFFVQTHVHPLTPPPAASQVAHVNPANDTGDDPATCPICRELTHAGSLISPEVPAISAPIVVPLLALLPTLSHWARRDRSHAWLGRGPPTRS